uniref:Uncharacterized protein n=1 Tax=Tanacetum cinerariifolium TaxID=118510 RepID=A0A6L2KJK1_TANCI|nr:hypothetical protein [Tanacetum cinerariifolium]
MPYKNDKINKKKNNEHNLDDVDLDAFDLKNRIKNLKEDFSRMLKAKKAKEAEDAKLKVSKVCFLLYWVKLFTYRVKLDKYNILYILMLAEVVQVSSDEDDSSDEGLSGDKHVVVFNDVKYPLTDAEIRMFKERPTPSKALTRQLASTSTRFIIPSTRSRAPTTSASTSSIAPILPLLLLKLPQDPELLLLPLLMHKLLLLQLKEVIRK